MSEELKSIKKILSYPTLCSFCKEQREFREIGPFIIICRKDLQEKGVTKNHLVCSGCHAIIDPRGKEVYHESEKIFFSDFRKGQSVL